MKILPGLEQRLKGRGIEIEAANLLMMDDYECMIDEKALEDAFDQIVSYSEDLARSHSSKPWIRFEATLFDDYLEIRVANSGVFVDRKDRERVFEPYPEVEASTVKPGLRLAKAKKILEAHGGSAMIETRGKVSVISIYLPRQRQELFTRLFTRPIR